MMSANLTRHGWKKFAPRCPNWRRFPARHATSCRRPASGTRAFCRRILKLPEDITPEQRQEMIAGMVDGNVVAAGQ